MSHINALQGPATFDREGALVNTSGPFSSPVQIPELIEEILSYLGRSDLVSSATVCKTWSEPALSRLWRHLFSLVPLLSLLSPIQCQNGGDMDFIHDIHDVDWSRYAFYAHRVRNISLADFGFQKPISVHAMQKFAACIPSLLAASLVTSITTFSLSPTPLPLHVVPFISQSLRTLHLKLAYPEEPSSQSACVRSMLAAVREAAGLPNSSLEELTLSSNITDTDLCAAISECLAKHQSTIFKLNLDLPIDHQVWSAICKLPYLREVAVSPFNSSEPGISARIIPMIQELVEAQPLLERFRVSLPASGFGPPEDPDLYRSVIRQLEGLHSLRSVEISANAPISLSEDDIREMGVSWPQIRIVRLQPRIVWSTPGQMAETHLSVLRSFLRHFPYLEELDLPWRCDSLPPAEQPMSKSLLRVLEVSGSPAPSVDPVQVASYLASLLPQTASVRYDAFMLGGEGKAIWQEIIRRFDCIRNARSQDPTNAPAI